MKRILAALLVIACGAAHAQQSDDISFARNAKGEVLALSMQKCFNTGFWWWHLEAPDGKTIQTGCWSIATHNRVMLTDGRGNVEYLPMSRFSTNPNFGE